MANNRSSRAAAFAIATFLALPVFAADNSDHAQDRIQIEKLMWQYARALDTANAEAYAAVYTPDGQFGFGPNATKGAAALKKLINDFKQRTAENEAKTGEKAAQLYHMTANSYLEFIDNDHARIEAYWMTMRAGKRNAPASVAAVGREVDELVRVKGQWLIKSREVAPGEAK